MGWALWLKNDWEGVVRHWEKVADMEPGREGLQQYLRQANDQHQLRLRIRAGRASAAKTFQIGCSSRHHHPHSICGRPHDWNRLSGRIPSAQRWSAVFDGVADVLRDADITFGNLEGPLCDGGNTNKCKPGAPTGSCYAFRMPAHYARYFKQAGFDMLSTANNHSGDFGERLSFANRTLVG